VGNEEVGLGVELGGEGEEVDVAEHEEVAALLFEFDAEDLAVELLETPDPREKASEVESVD